jgi:hypothetical protein
MGFAELAMSVGVMTVDGRGVAEIGTDVGRGGNVVVVQNVVVEHDPEEQGVCAGGCGTVDVPLPSQLPKPGTQFWASQ